MQMRCWDMQRRHIGMGSVSVHLFSQHDRGNLCFKRGATAAIQAECMTQHEADGCKLGPVPAPTSPLSACRHVRLTRLKRRQAWVEQSSDWNAALASASMTPGGRCGTWACAVQQRGMGSELDCSRQHIARPCRLPRTALTLCTTRVIWSCGHHVMAQTCEVIPVIPNDFMGVWLSRPRDIRVTGSMAAQPYVGRTTTVCGASHARAF